MPSRRRWQQFEVVLTGAFLTGQPLQVRVADYCEVQRNLGESLAERTGEGWRYEPLEWQDIAGSYDIRGGYPSLVPLVLLGRGGEELERVAEETRAARPALERRWLSAAMGGCGLTLRSISIELFDFGVGVIKGRYEVSVPPWTSAETARSAVDAASRLKPDRPRGVRSPIATSYEQITVDTVRAFREAVRAHAGDARQEPWLAPLQAALEPRAANGGATATAGRPGSAPSEWGRLLWLHPVYVLGVRRGASGRELERIARPFQPAFVKTVAVSDGLFSPGIESSLIVVRGDIAARRDDLMRLVVLHWAYYALFMEIDRGLLATLDSDKWDEPAARSSLEEDAERMFSVYMRVQETKARLNSVLADLGGGALTLWDAIADVQRFSELMSSVEGKVENLQRVSERRVQEASGDRARRAGNILGGLAALTVVTVAIGLFGSVVGSRADPLGHVGLRWLTIAAALVVAALLYWRQRELVKRRRRARRLTVLRRRPHA